MNCNELREVINEFIDGDLSRLSFDEARVHVSECDGCRTEVARARKLVDEAASLPREMGLERDLWKGIEGKLELPGAAGGSPDEGRGVAGAAAGALWRAGLAAALVVAMVAAGLIASRLLRTEVPTGDAVPVAAAGPAHEPGVLPTASGRSGMGEAGRAFLEAKQALRLAFREQRGALSQSTVSKVEENLKIIESAVAEIQGALERDPGNRQLERMLVAAQQREVALLRKVTQTAVLQQR